LELKNNIIAGHKLEIKNLNDEMKNKLFNLENKEKDI